MRGERYRGGRTHLSFSSATPLPPYCKHTPHTHTHTHTHTHKTKYRSRNSYIQSHGTVHKKYAQNTRTHAHTHRHSETQTKGTRQRKAHSHIPLCQERFASWLSESLESHNRPTEPVTDRQSLTRALLELTRALTIIEESHSQTEPATDRQTDI